MSKKERRAMVGTQQAFPYLADAPIKDQTDIIERMYRRVLTELSCNRFEWTGLPDEIDKRFLEVTLFRSALSVFYFDTSFDRYFALRASGGGAINMYDNPTTFTVTGNTMVNKTLHARECVPIWSNYMRTPDYDIVSVYARRFANVERTIDINLQAMRYTHIITAPENERLSWVNLMRQYTEGQPLILGTTGLDLSQIQHFPVSVEKDQVLNLQLTKSKMWNDCMTLLGINNANQDKKERLVASEVDANNGQVMATRGIALNARREACDQINKMFGLKVSVNWNENMPAGADPAVTELKVY